MHTQFTTSVEFPDAHQEHGEGLTVVHQHPHTALTGTKLSAQTVKKERQAGGLGGGEEGLLGGLTVVHQHPHGADRHEALRPDGEEGAHAEEERREGVRALVHHNVLVRQVPDEHPHHYLPRKKG